MEAKRVTADVVFYSLPDGGGGSVPDTDQKTIRLAQIVPANVTFLSIIIACWNEPENLAGTLTSIEETAKGFPLEIIVIDDASEKNFNWPELVRGCSFPLIALHNISRQGHATCRQMGSASATGEWLLFTDAHMIFEPGWFEAFRLQIPHVSEPTLFCGPWVASRSEWETINHPPDLFWGARFYYWERFGSQIDILSYKPLGASAECADWSFEVPCVIGANYFLRRDWFQHIGGLKNFIGWSCLDEFMLSVKTWLCGGSVKLIPDVRLRHVLHPTGHDPIAGGSAPGYGKAMDKAQLIYNKLAAAYELFPARIFQTFLSFLPRDDPLAFDEALKMIRERRDSLEASNAHLDRHAAKGHAWLCSKFKIYHPSDIGAAQYLN